MEESKNLLADALRAILAGDRTLLSRSAELNERIDAAENLGSVFLERQALQDALASTNIGELLYVADRGKKEQRKEALADARTALQDAGIAEEDAERILRTITSALDWDKAPAPKPARKKAQADDEPPVWMKPQASAPERPADNDDEPPVWAKKPAAPPGADAKPAGKPSPEDAAKQEKARRKAEKLEKMKRIAEERARRSEEKRMQRQLEREAKKALRQKAEEERRRKEREAEAAKKKAEEERLRAEAAAAKAKWKEQQRKEREEKEALLHLTREEALANRNRRLAREGKAAGTATHASDSDPSAFTVVCEVWGLFCFLFIAATVCIGIPHIIGWVAWFPEWSNLAIVSLILAVVLVWTINKLPSND